MCAAEKTRNEEEAKNAGTGCRPGDFRKMFGKMGACCDTAEGFPDCSSMTQCMTEAMNNQACCEPTAKTNE